MLLKEVVHEGHLSLRKVHRTVLAVLEESVNSGSLKFHMLGKYVEDVGHDGSSLLTELNQDLA